ncbi:hypothetical protein C0Q70_03023 [Pomacea canaliculata]|uniref:Uncharacterized protein n=1 Tax=Pomacea canaliculata TaxID=400727 RepID=A0A2T7PRK4_POMCA|nr:hypothetical protein C0Q70_03023 [Pomacea canaliculata]
MPSTLVLVRLGYSSYHVVEFAAIPTTTTPTTTTSTTTTTITTTTITTTTAPTTTTIACANSCGAPKVGGVEAKVLLNSTHCCEP